MSTIAVVIPTLRRPEQLKAAVQSLWLLNDPRRVSCLIIVDNDPLASAQNISASLNAASPFPVRYVHVPEAGIANARNAGVKAAQDFDFIAFLDDDEIAHPQWLDQLASVQVQFDADVVFGPIQGRAYQAPAKLRPALDAFFSRSGPDRDGLIDTPYGCGNSLLKTRTALAGDAPFAAHANETGGEDDILFARLKDQGLSFAWAASAWVDEVAPSNRCNLRYLLVRSFARGQGPSQTAYASRKFGSLLRWMLIGVAQLGLYGAGALLAGLTLTSAGIALMIKASSGLGKMLWFNQFEPKLYGAHELSNR